MTKVELLEDLFPDESPDADQQPDDAELAPKRKKQETIQTLDVRAAQLRGTPTQTHSVWDLTRGRWNMVDRLNEDYHMFFHCHGSKQAVAFAVESFAHYLLMTCRAVWEEHRCEHAVARANGDKSAAESVHRHTLPTFIKQVAEQIASE